MAVPLNSSRPRLTGILCTYRRPDLALLYLDRLETQTLRPDLVVVVDNSSDAELRAAIETRRGSIEVWYVDPRGNVGPAGAFDLGFRTLAPKLSPDDLVAHFDDDDLPVHDSQLAILVDELRRCRESDTTIGGIGLSGGRLNTRTGVVRTVTGTMPVEEVDHLHGGYLPVYLKRALDEVDGNDPTFFYGFEELELGRRLHLRGWKLLVHNELMAELRDRYEKKGATARARLRIDEGDLGWSRFHKERNLIRILHRERRWTALAVTGLGRELAKPLLGMPLQPRAAATRLRLGWRATVAGLRNEGGIDARYPPA